MSKIEKEIKKINKKIKKGVNQIGNKVEQTAYQIGNKVEQTANRLVNFASKVVFNTKSLSPFVLNFMAKHGEKDIVKMTLARADVPIAIRKLMYSLSDAQEKKLYHLYLIIVLVDGTKFILEKNERINITTTIPKAVQILEVNESFNGDTLNNLVYGAKKELGDKKFYNYNASTSNCQTFIRSVMISNQLLTTEREIFIKQDTADLFRDNDLLRKFSNTIVNEVAGRFNILTSGGEIQKKISSSNIIMNKWLLHVAQFRKNHPNLSYKQVLIEAKKTYTKVTK